MVVFCVTIHMSILCKTKIFLLHRIFLNAVRLNQFNILEFKKACIMDPNTEHLNIPENISSTKNQTKHINFIIWCFC